MLFLVVGTPWKRPRSSRPCRPVCGDDWFGGKSSTKTATLDSTTKFSWKRIEFILDHLHELLSLHRSPADTNKGTLRIAVIILVVIVLFFAFAFVFLFVFILVGLLSKETISSYRAVRGICVKVFWTYSAHAQWYAP